MNKLNSNKDIVSFNKNELYKIMEIYSKKISIGEWKDYSICFRKNYALFCIHKSSYVQPSFEIMKKKGNETTFSLKSNNKLLKKSNSLSKILEYFKKPKLTLVS